MRAADSNIVKPPYRRGSVNVTVAARYPDAKNAPFYLDSKMNQGVDVIYFSGCDWYDYFWEV